MSSMNMKGIAPDYAPFVDFYFILFFAFTDMDHKLCLMKEKSLKCKKSSSPTDDSFLLQEKVSFCDESQIPPRAGPPYGRGG